MKSIRMSSMVVLATGLALSASALGQTSQAPGNPAAPITSESAEHKTAGPVTWTTDQLMTASVHDAWVMSGKNEATFFEMVTQLAAISAQKRGLQLPETREAGEKFGELVKSMAKADHDQLLYVVVDKAVQQVATKS